MVVLLEAEENKGVLSRCAQRNKTPLFSSASRSTTMRTNLPVTNIEYPIHDDTLIVSKTDLKGKLSYFNDQFVHAAGFTEAELMGQPHNIIRHPDMPSEAFEDLW